MGFVEIFESYYQRFENYAFYKLFLQFANSYSAARILNSNGFSFKSGKFILLIRTLLFNGLDRRQLRFFQANGRPEANFCLQPFFGRFDPVI